ncbi:MAG: FCD domain-containing protein [Proteobacteria bacterium]|nr:FCD domain-containing protein [Pseudomonadota bacterium]
MAGTFETTAAIELVRTRSLPALVQEEIIRMIREGELSRGDKLNESGLAATLGVSRGPVREAFQALVESGLLRQEKNRGVFVRTLSTEEVVDIYNVRAALDRLVGETVVLTVTEADLEGLRDLVARMDEAAAKRNIEVYYPLNLDFHGRILELSGNSRLIAMNRRLIDELHLCRRRNLLEESGMAASNEEHRRIVDEIAGGDPEGAGSAMYDHVTAALGRQLRLIRDET